MGKTVEELKAKAKMALNDPNLVEITKNVALNPNGKVNLTQAYDKAFEYGVQQTQDLQKSKKLATATRWLAMLRRDYEKDFLEFISKNETQTPRLKEKKKENLRERKFKVPVGTKLITERRLRNHPGYFNSGEICHLSFKEIQMNSVTSLSNDPDYSIWVFCKEILEAMLNSAKSEIDNRLTTRNIGGSKESVHKALEECKREILKLFE